MSTKTAFSTLKIILIIDLLIVAIAAPSYLYVDSLVPKEASFELSNLVINPEWVQFGEPVQVSVKVSNVGEKGGDYTVTLIVDNETTATETVRLSGQNETTLVFSLTEVEIGDHVINIEDLNGTIKVTSDTPIRPATLQITDLGVSRIEAGVGDMITISATAFNVGDEPGEFTIDLLINDQKIETKTIQLEAKESELLQFEVIENNEGTYEVKLGDLITQFKITTEAEPAKPAEFKLTDLIVDPTSILGGESVTVSVKVTNVGEETGSYTVDLNIDGSPKDSQEVSLSGGATKVVTFIVTETVSGSHTVEVGNLSNSFDVENLSPASKDIEINKVNVKPYEVWEGDTVTLTLIATNLVNEPGTLQVRVLHNDEVKATKGFEMAASAKEVQLELTFTAGAVGKYPLKIVNLGNEENTKTGYFTVVETGMHTLTVSSYPVLGIPFVQDGVEYKTSYAQLLPVGEYHFEVEPTYDSGKYLFVGWEDNSTSLTRTVTLDERKTITVDFSGGICCPSVFTWNGTDYYYTAEISNPGWLGYIGYITDKGEIVFVGGNPWDGVKLNPDELAIREIGSKSYYDITLTQKWDEIFYLDAAYLLVVDHPTDVDVYSTIVRYTNPKYTDEIFTINNALTPISAVNEKGEDVLYHISEMDGIFTPGINGLDSERWQDFTWNQLTIDLGDLSNAEQIKLLIKGMVDWGPADIYYDRIDKFQAAASEGLMPNGTEITPPPFIEVLDVNGNWVRVPEERQTPIPADYVARPFVVDLTGIFLTNNYKIRLNNFWNVTFDYIGVDTSPKENLTIQKLDPVAELRQVFETPSEASGKFTRYGDVTELVKECDDKFVIGMQGDEVALLFSIDDLDPIQGGTERAFFLFGACWFKDTPNNWGYGFDFTVEPMPFRNMTGFPYSEPENYPYDAEHKTYIQEYNSRKIIDPRSLEPQPASLTAWVGGVLLVMVIIDTFIIYFRKRNKQNL
ncbi:hypothetical protein E2P63_03455 [Candidatus Bathyarchaeota archaeon]|nr:hypothetical protein E2P63_03455 [Candidatus Bathyarchaeota archaeon]